MTDIDLDIPSNLVPKKQDSFSDTKKRLDLMVGEAIPEMAQVNITKLKGAYRHPFEYINPRLY